MISVRKKHKLCTERTPMCPFATRIAADTMFFRPRSKSKGRLAQKIAHVEIAPEKKVTGGWVIYDFYYGYKIPAAKIRGKKNAPTTAPKSEEKKDAPTTAPHSLQKRAEII